MAGLFKRGKLYHIRYMMGNREIRRSLKTTSLQIAKEKKRQIESKLAMGENSPFPSQTLVSEIVDEYVRHMRATKTAKSAQADKRQLRRSCTFVFL